MGNTDTKQSQVDYFNKKVPAKDVDVNAVIEAINAGICYYKKNLLKMVINYATKNELDVKIIHDFRFQSDDYYAIILFSPDWRGILFQYTENNESVDEIRVFQNGKEMLIPNPSMIDFDRLMPPNLKKDLIRVRGPLGGSDMPPSRQSRL